MYSRRTLVSRVTFWEWADMLNEIGWNVDNTLYNVAPINLLLLGK